MTVLLGNATVNISGTVSLTGLNANFQQDGRDEAKLPRLLMGAGSEDMDKRMAYRVTVDKPATYPAIGDIVTVTAYDDAPELVGTAWSIWEEPVTDPMFGALEIAVVRKIS